MYPSNFLQIENNQHFKKTAVEDYFSAILFDGPAVRETI